jgi:hypothetical protein
VAAVPSVPDDVADVGRVTAGESGEGVVRQPAFIIGCARSGTSILGEAVAEHPRVTYIFEASSWRGLEEGRPHDRLERADATPELARAYRAALASARNEGRGDVIVEKNPRHVLRIPFLDAVFPDARFIHIIRDPRDTVASLMFRNRGERWGHLEIPGWQELLRRYPTENHIRCAHQWLAAVATARADARGLGPGRCLEVRYEDLVRDPAGVVGATLTFLGLEPDPRVDAFLPRIQDATAGSYHAKRQVRHYVDDHSRRVGRHMENLSAAQIQEIDAVTGPLARELGYDAELPREGGSP